MSNPVNVQRDVAPEFVHGKKVIGTTAGQLTTFSRPSYKGVQLKADPDNTGLVYIGSTPGVTADSAVATDGFPLEAGDPLFLPIDDPSKIYVIGTDADQGIFWIMI